MYPDLWVDIIFPRNFANFLGQKVLKCLIGEADRGAKRQKKEWWEFPLFNPASSLHFLAIAASLTLLTHFIDSSIATQVIACLICHSWCSTLVQKNSPLFLLLLKFLYLPPFSLLLQVFEFIHDLCYLVSRFYGGIHNTAQSWIFLCNCSSKEKCFKQNWIVNVTSKGNFFFDDHGVRDTCHQQQVPG